MDSLVRLQEHLKPIIEEFTTGEFFKEVVLAKKEYFEKAGIVHDDDAGFEERMNAFMDWYLFDRDLPGIDLPPIKLFCRNNLGNFNEEKKAIYQSLTQTTHSIFQMKMRPWFKTGIRVEDLFTKKKYAVEQTRNEDALQSGDIFEARIIPFEGKLIFSEGFCFHPTEMGSFIISEIKKVRFQDRPRQTKLILQLAGMKLRHLRFHHIDVKHIYKFDSRLTV